MLTIPESNDAEISASRSDMLIVTMKQGNACEVKWHVLLCRGLRKYSPIAELGERSGKRIKSPING